MMHRLGGQPDSYDKKYALLPPRQQWHFWDYRSRSKYRFGRTLGAGTYGIVREAEGPDGKCAIKIILKKNVKGNEQMVYDEMDMLARMKHPHIVRFWEWFESKVRPWRPTHLLQPKVLIWIG
jgi:calcium/calmodulin-dependent protein kinase I